MPRTAGQVLRWTIWAAVPIAVGVVAFSHRAALVRAVGLLEHAHLAWMVPAVAAIAAIYLCRAFVYGVPLTLLRYRFPRLFLWQIAIISTSLHQLIPAGGATGYAFLTWALNQRGATGGQASLIALVDTLSYAAAMATLVVGSVAYLLVAGTVDMRDLLFGFVPGVAIVAAAGYLYYLQRDRRRFVPLVLRVERWLAARSYARWPQEPVRRFLEQFYEAKTIIGQRGAFVRMVGFQYLSIVCDSTALYCACLALDVSPKPWVVFMAFVVSMAGGAVVSAPGGGGSFEVIMAAFLARHGFTPSQGIAVALLYRIVAFWLPVIVSLVMLPQFRHRKKELRRRGKRAGRARVA